MALSDAGPGDAVNGTDSLKVLVVDDHDVVHWGFRLLLDRQGWVERCDGASGLAEAVEFAANLRPDVALIDLMLGTDSGAEACSEIRAVSPQTRVLLISGAGRISLGCAKRRRFRVHFEGLGSGGCGQGGTHGCARLRGLRRGWSG